jgi:hypothetical protein
MDYNILRGGMLPIGLVGLTFAPLIAAWVRGVFGPQHECKLVLYGSGGKSG